MLLLRVQGLLVICLWWSCGKAVCIVVTMNLLMCHFHPVSSYQLGPQNCTATVAINKPLSNTVTIYVPSGTACFECIIDGVVTTDATFLIGNSVASEGSVVNGTLVVSDTESVFSTPANVRCGIDNVTNQVTVEHTSK